MPSGKEFRLWGISDAHVGTDIRYDRESLADAIRQAENGGDEGGPAFDWDIALNLGDFSGSQVPPDDAEGEEVRRQYSVSTKHPREHFYDVIGNHDASGKDEPTQWWFQKWLDPVGRHSEHSGIHADRRPYPVEGTWERYSFQVGNVLFLTLADRNDGGPPIGRGEFGGYPAGAISQEAFDWWVSMVESNQDKIIISGAHHMLRGTTVASGDWEGVDNGYHGRFEAGAPIGASHIHWVGGVPQARSFEKYLEQHPSAIDLWLGAHTHTHPDDVTGGRSHVERVWDVNFVNIACLSRYHGQRVSIPKSRLFTFIEGSEEVRVQCYLHTSQYAPQGWYEPAERTIKLRHRFEK